MTTAAYLLLYGAFVTWLSPWLLARLTRRGLSPRLGIAVWMTAIVGALLAWTAAITLVVAKSVTGVPGSAAIVLCLEILGISERVATPGRASVLALIAAGLVVTAVVAAKVSRSVYTVQSRSRHHADVARMIGIPTDRPDVFVVAADRPAAYCVAGKPNTIVVTSGAMATLDDAQLTAVLAHEDAHIRGHHHHVLAVLTALAGSLPRLPLFTRGAVAVAELLEMRADDAAARRHGARPLVAGMLVLAGPLPHLAGGLAVAATAVFTRANRLVDPARRGTRWSHQFLAMATMTVIIGAPFVINALCHH